MGRSRATAVRRSSAGARGPGFRGLALGAVMVLCGPSVTVAQAPRQIDGPDPVPVADGVPNTIPPPGHATRTTLFLADGDERSVLVQTSALGVTTVIPGPSGIDDDGIAATRPRAPCQDRAYRLSSGPWQEPYAWWFKANTTPKGMDRAAVRDAIIRSVGNVTHARNDCGRPDHVGARSVYRGITGRVESCVDTLGYGKNVVLFGSLPPGVAGQAETCYDVGSSGVLTPTMSHVVFNKRVPWAIRTRGCRGRMILGAVGTHEFAHVFGLDHVYGRAHARLTMTPGGVPCDASPSTLGLGDMLGLERLYPTT